MPGHSLITMTVASLLLIAILAFSLAVPVYGDCFYPDGTPDIHHSPCELPGLGAMTSCCHDFDMCLNNRVCAHVNDSGATSYYRGTCSNEPDWNSDLCPKFCLGESAEDQAIGEWPMGQCPGLGDRWFCLGGEPGDGTSINCSDPKFGFELTGNNISSRLYHIQNCLADPMDYRQYVGVYDDRGSAHPDRRPGFANRYKVRLGLDINQRACGQYFRAFHYLCRQHSNQQL